MKPVRGGGPQGKTPEQILKEMNDIGEMLQMPAEAFTPGQLESLEPEKWKNVGASVILGVKAIKDHQIETDQYLSHIKKFLDKFFGATSTFIKQSAQELDETKKKVAKDMLQFDRDVQDRIKSNKMENADALKATREGIETVVYEIRAAVMQCVEKIEQCDTRVVMLEKVEDIYKPQLETITQSIQSLTENVDLRIMKIYEEELWDQGNIGTDPKLPFKHLKDYFEDQIGQIRGKALLFTQETQKSFKQIQETSKTLNELLSMDLFPRTERLEKTSLKYVQQNSQFEIILESCKQTTNLHDLKINKLFRIVEQDENEDVVTVLSRVYSIIKTTTSAINLELLQVSEAMQVEVKKLEEKFIQMEKKGSEQVLQTKLSKKLKDKQKQKLKEMEEKAKQEKKQKKEAENQKQKSQEEQAKAEEEKQKELAKQEKQKQKQLEEQAKQERKNQKALEEEQAKKKKLFQEEQLKAEKKLKKEQEEQVQKQKQFEAEQIKAEKKQKKAIDDAAKEERLKQELIKAAENEAERLKKILEVQDQAKEERFQEVLKATEKETQILKNEIAQQNAQQEKALLSAINQATVFQSEMIQQKVEHQHEQQTSEFIGTAEIKPKEQIIQIHVQQLEKINEEVPKYQDINHSTQLIPSAAVNETPSVIQKQLNIPSDRPRSANPPVQHKTEQQQDVSMQHQIAIVKPINNKSTHTPSDKSSLKSDRQAESDGEVIEQVDSIRDEIRERDSDDEPADQNKPQIISEKAESDKEESENLNSDKQSYVSEQTSKSKTSEEENQSDSSSSESSSSQASERMELIRTLKLKVKGIKSKMEVLQTKHMQLLFSNRDFQNQVNQNFSKIKIEVLEQIVQSRVIQDIIKMSNAKKTAKNSPFKEQTPQSAKFWEVGPFPQARDFNKIQTSGSTNAVRKLKLKQITTIPMTAQPSHLQVPVSRQTSLSPKNGDSLDVASNSIKQLDAVLSAKALVIRHESFGQESFPDLEAKVKKPSPVKQLAVKRDHRPTQNLNIDLNHDLDGALYQENIIMKNGKFILREPRHISP